MRRNQKKFKTQVPPEHYFAPHYLKPERLVQFSIQQELIRKYVKPKSSILEIGIGNKILNLILQGLGYRVYTLDFDEALLPDYVADVRDLSEIHEKFDATVLFEVLEHLPVTDLEKAIKELTSITKKYIIISVPNKKPYFRFEIKIPLLYRRFFYKIFKNNHIILHFFFHLPLRLKHKFNGEHYWELNCRRVSEKQLVDMFRKNNFILVSKKTFFEEPRSRFFVFRKGKVA